jgi:hypothetical protein
MDQVAFVLRSPTRPQMLAVHLACNDLAAAIGQPILSFYVSPVALQRFDGELVFSAEAFVNDHPKTVAHTVWEESGEWVISVRPDLAGAELHATLLHELGHVLGLSHVERRGHVMNRNGLINGPKRKNKASIRQRRRWAGQVASELVRVRVRERIA